MDQSQRIIRERDSGRADSKVVIAVEEVWNKFLLSPIEFVSMSTISSRRG